MPPRLPPRDSRIAEELIEFVSSLEKFLGICSLNAFPRVGGEEGRAPLLGRAARRHLPASEGSRVFWGRRMEDGKRRSASGGGGVDGRAQPPLHASSGVSGAGKRAPEPQGCCRRRSAAGSAVCPRAERCAASVARRKGGDGFGRVGEAVLAGRAAASGAPPASPRVRRVGGEPARGAT